MPHLIILDKQKQLIKILADAITDFEAIHEALEALPENDSTRLDNEEAMETLAGNFDNYATATEFEINAIKTSLGIE